MLWWTVAVAMAGYGDAVDGYPSHAERSMHLWTNAVRVDPLAFEADYQMGGCTSDGFSSAERSAIDPLVYHHDLSRAARAHSEDMYSNDWFDHDSSDGTSWDVRISSYYSGWSAIAENIAYGYPSAEVAVLQGWMCSSGHRANIMSGSYNELGSGVVSSFYTQDFGQRSSAPVVLMSMGLHEPEDPSSSVELLVAVHDDAEPIQVMAVLDGDELPLDLVYGTAQRGVYAGTSSTDPSCHSYYFLTIAGDGTEHRFPEQGSYGWGDCAWDDPDARWLASQEPGAGGPEDTGPTGPPGPDPSDTSGDPAVDTAVDTGAFITGKPGGCTHLGGGGGLAVWGLWVLLGFRRREVEE